MNIKGLRAFRLVVDKGSLAAAAEELHLSQPAVSRLLAIVETETGLNLFNRTRRKLALTREGEEFFKESAHILSGFDEIPLIAESIRTKSHRNFRLVTAPRIGQGLASPAIALMRKENPHIQCRIDILGRFELEGRAGTRRYDLGLVSLPVSNSYVSIVNEPLFRLRMEVLMPEEHRLAAQDSVSAADLAGEDMLGLHPELLWRQQVDDFFRSGGVKVNYAVETSSSLMACQLVGDGAGITILDRICAEAIDTTGLVLRPLKPERWISFGYVHQRDHELSSNALIFLDCLQRTIENFRVQSSGNESAIVSLGDGGEDALNSAAKGSLS